jgi:hypothetical protein
MQLTHFQSWCETKGIESCLQIQETRQGFRYTTLAAIAPENVSRRRRPFSPWLTPATTKTMMISEEDRLNLLRIPVEACITSRDSESLVDRLLFETSLGASSEYAPYIETMPSLETFHAMPRFWSAERLESVTDGGQLDRALEMDRLRYRYQDPWALACVDSRSHFLPNGDGYSLTPVLDMINHDSSVKTSLRIDRGSDQSQIMCLDVASPSSVTLKQTSSLSPKSSSWWDSLIRSDETNLANDRHAEIRISYGDFTNVHTLLNYGFIVAQNPNNVETVSIRLIYRQTPVIIVVRSNGSIEEDGLGQLRSALANTEERQEIILPLLQEREMITLPFVSRRNEEDVMALVEGELEVAVEQATEGLRNCRHDELVTLYLSERIKTLQRALERIQISS